MSLACSALHATIYSTFVQHHLHYIQIKQQYVVYSKATNILLNLSGLANQWSLASNLATLLVQTCEKKCADSSLQFAYGSNGLIGYEKVTCKSEFHARGRG